MCDAPGESYFFADSSGISCEGKEKETYDKICCCQIKDRPGQCLISQKCPNDLPCIDGYCKEPIVNSVPVTQTAKFVMPILQIKIPGLEEFNNNELCTKDGRCGIPWLAQYIRAIYNYAIAVAGILAAIVLMAGGVIWLISGGDSSKVTQAKELIFGSISGLVILASSYILLTQINPDLVTLKTIDLIQVRRLDFLQNGSESFSNSSNRRPCPTDNNLVSISNIVSSSASDPRLDPRDAEGLKKAVAIADQQKVKLQVTSAFRSYDLQKTLWDAALKNNNNDVAKAGLYVAPPTQCEGLNCYGHCAGAAIDVCIAGSVSCSHIGGNENAKYSDDDVIKLEKIMQLAGWTRYCNEWWHYQYSLTPGIACSP